MIKINADASIKKNSGSSPVSLIVFMNIGPLHRKQSYFVNINANDTALYRSISNNY